MKHFLFVSNKLPPVCDGVGDHTFFIARTLNAQGHRISVITCQNEIDQEVLAFAEVCCVKDWTSVENHRKILDFVEGQNPDFLVWQYVSYAFDRFGLPFFLPRLINRVANKAIPVIIWFHEIAIRYRLHPKYFVVALGQRWIANRLASRAKLIITSIDKYANMLSAHGSKVKLIPSGANLNTKSIDQFGRSRLREQIAPKTDQLIVVFGKRDIRFFLPVFQRLRAVVPGLGLLLIGDHFKSQLTEPVPPGIFLHGYADKDQLFELIAIADIGFLPDPVDEKGRGGTSNKSGSLAALFAAGLPVIGVKGDMNNQLLVHGENIWLLNFTGHVFYQEIQLLLADERKMNCLADRGRKLYDSNLSWASIGNSFLDASKNIA